MKKNQRGFTLYELIIVIMFASILVLIPVSLWVGASAVTSGIKSAKGDCGTTYGIESVLSGDWFCPESKE